MAVHEIIETENIGLAKEIDQNSLDLIFKSVQETIYSFPEKSFIREIFSNGYDSLQEKKIAIDILQNKAPVDKYYLTRNEAVVKDSNFDPSYYNLKYLEIENKPINIIYTERTEKLKDLISIEDFGVGLSNYRLKNSTKLGWSTKRNSSHAIGKFGQGNKSGLATGADYYTMTTFYNGYTATLMIYKENFHSINLKTNGSKIEIWKGFSKDGTALEIPIIWNPTDKKNGAIVTMEVPKYTKEKYIKAIKDQLTYFKGSVICSLYLDSELIQDINIGTNYLYESDSFIIPEYSSYSEPHIIINNINYGKIEWPEMGLEKRYGNIAIKAVVPVSNSREHIIWNEEARKILQNSIEEVTKEAEIYLNSKISAPDNFFEWLKLVSQVSVSADDQVIRELGRFIPKSNLNFGWDISDIYNILPVKNHPSKKVDTIYRKEEYFEWLFDSFNVTYVTIDSTLLADGKRVPKLTQISLSDFHKFSYCQDIYYAKEKTISLYLIEYLFEKKDINSIIYIREKTDKQKELKRITETNYVTLELLKEHSTTLDTFEIPDSYLKQKELEKKETEKREIEKVEEIKKKSKERKKNIINIKFIRFDGYYGNNVIQSTVYHYSDYYVLRYYSYNNINKPVFSSYVKENEEGLREKYDTFIYAETVNKELLLLIAQMLHDCSITKKESRIAIGVVSKESAKKLAKFEGDFAINITDFIMERTENGIKLHELFNKYNTGRKVSEILQEHPYLRHFKLFEDISEDFKVLKDKWEFYKEVPINTHSSVKEIMNLHYPSDTINPIFDALDEYLRNTEKLQRAIYEKDEIKIVELSKELFDSDTPLTISAIDVEFIEALENLVRLVEPAASLFMHLDYKRIEEDGQGDEITSILKKLL